MSKKLTDAQKAKNKADKKKLQARCDRNNARLEAQMAAIGQYFNNIGIDYDNCNLMLTVGDVGNRQNLRVYYDYTASGMLMLVSTVGTKVTQLAFARPHAVSGKIELITTDPTNAQRGVTIRARKAPRN